VADIFISYARSDRPRVKPIADRLAALGYQVWWDREIVAGAAFVEDINRELDQARVVLVAWSRASLNSVWVFGESLRALETYGAQSEEAGRIAALLRDVAAELHIDAWDDAPLRTMSLEGRYQGLPTNSVEVWLPSGAPAQSPRLPAPRPR
jgi:hypothetical protein